MKCPNCGKKSKKCTCASSTVSTTKAAKGAANVNYFTYDPKNPGVVYPLSVAGQGQPNPAYVVEEVPAKKGAKGAKKDLKAAQAVAKDDVKAAQLTAKASQVTSKAAQKVAKVEEKNEKALEKVADKFEKKAAKKAAKEAKAVAAAEKAAAKEIAAAKKAADKAAKAAEKAELQAAKADLKAKKALQKVSEASEKEDIKNAKKAEKKAAKAAKVAAKAEQEAARAEQRVARAEQEAARVAQKAIATKNWATRLFAVVLMAASIATLAVLSFGAVLQYVKVGENNVPSVHYGSLVTIFTTAIGSEAKAFGLLPALFTGANGDLYNLSVYVFVAFAVVAAVFAVAANISTDKCPMRVTLSLIFLGLGALIYAGAMALVLKDATIAAESLSNVSLLNIGGFYFDTFSFILGIAALALGLVRLLPNKND